jgi:hypothetical protein
MSEPSELSPAASTPVGTGLSGEWEQRALCPDESCLGVLGTDGRCRLCGLRGDLSQPPEPGMQPVAQNDAEPPAQDQAAASQSSPSDARSGEDFDERALCDRDDCIGILGPDGACKECGSRPAALPS